MTTSFKNGIIVLDELNDGKYIYFVTVNNKGNFKQVERVRYYKKYKRMTAEEIYKDLKEKKIKGILRSKEYK